MSAVYAETSAILAWLLGESGATATMSAINDASSVFTSVLTEVEVRRSLIRAEATGMISEAARAHLLGVFETVSHAWIIMEITSDVCARASMRFPVEPVRSLDAIHLATALEFTRIAQSMRILSFARRVVANLEPLGLVHVLTD